MEITFYPGDDISKAVEALSALKAKGIYASGQFNDATLTTKMSEDEAYQAVTGNTKAEFEQAQKEWHNQYQKELREHEESIPSLIPEWITKGHAILDEAYWELWDKAVPIRLSDLYRGMELGNCLEIIEVLNGGGNLDEAQIKIELQGHSGMSFSLVCGMVRVLCDRGEEFVDSLSESD